MIKFTDKEYAEYMLANYYLGYSDIAYFMAAILFEGHIMKSIKQYEKAYIDEYNKKKQSADREKDRLELSEAISRLYMENRVWKNEIFGNLSKKDAKNILLIYKDLRNLIAHGGIQNLHHKKEIKLKKTKNRDSLNVNLNDFIVDVYSLVTGETCSHKCLEKKTAETLKYDYKLKEIDERMISKKDDLSFTIKSKAFKDFPGLVPQDYENLFLLREKLILLQNYISGKISEVGLKSTTLTPIDTTSAYIWMPFYDKKFINNSHEIMKTGRPNLIMGTTSILATPLDLRIYIDFGGGDYNFRYSYQEFIISDVFKTYIRRFHDIHPELKVFTTRWYSFIVEEPDNVLDVLETIKFKKRAESAKTFIENAKTKDDILTSGRNLIGFILPSSEVISKELILSLFKEIAHLYYEYLAFKYPEYEIVLREKQELLMEEENEENEDNPFGYYDDDSEDDSEWY